jgi:hypothetical protein
MRAIGKVFVPPFGALPLGKDVTADSEVILPYERRDLGVAIMGRSGTGKSSVMQRMILSDLRQRRPAFVIDPHGLLTDQIISNAPADALDRIILLEALASSPFGLNLLAIRDAVDKDDDPVTWAADSVVQTFKKLYGESEKFMPRLERYLHLSARTLIPARGTVADISLLLEDADFRRWCISKVHNQAKRRALQNSWSSFEKLRPSDQAEYIDPVLSRLEPVLSSELLQGILGSEHTTVPFDAVLSGDSIIVVRLPSEKITPQRADFIASLLLCALADRLFVRKTNPQPDRLHLYLDEYHRYATATTAELLTQGRKFGAGVTMAHQDLHQIKDDDIRNAFRHVGTLIALAVTRPDADELAGEFPVEARPEWLQEIEDVDGEKPEYIPVRNPVEHLLTVGHTNKLVVEAATAQFDTPTYGLTPKDYTEANKLLVDVMHGLPQELAAERIFPFIWQIPDPVRADPDQLAAHAELMGAIRRWFDAHLAIREQLTASFPHDPSECSVLDDELVQFVHEQGCWRGFFAWIGYGAFINPGDARARDETFKEHCLKARSSLQRLLILCDGLAEAPIETVSGQYSERKTKRHVLHAPQSQADAVSELAGRFVSLDPRDHIAHVRVSAQHHEVKLYPPPMRDIDVERIEEVLKRSRMMWEVVEQDEPEGASKNRPAGGQDEPPPDGIVSRHPRPKR